MKNYVKFAIATAVLLVLAACTYGWLRAKRQTPEMMRETNKAVRKEFRAAPEAWRLGTADAPGGAATAF